MVIFRSREEFLIFSSMGGCMQVLCPLCKSGSSLFYEDKTRTFYKCCGCLSVFVDKNDFPSGQLEKKRYQSHSNDVNDPGYRAFVSPIVDFIRKHYTRVHQGLDYGSGPGPVIAKMLSEAHFSITTYDPIFNPKKEALQEEYDFIICSEVMEHFHNPALEFEGLYRLINKGGRLVCMTDLYNESIDFPTWYYKNDFTHVFFYHVCALEYIHKKFGFKSLDVRGRLIVFQK